jgi:hypothetical protein
MKYRRFLPSTMSTLWRNSSDQATPPFWPNFNFLGRGRSDDDGGRDRHAPAHSGVPLTFLSQGGHFLTDTAALPKTPYCKTVLATY